jgi:hypothetical protein
MKMESRKQLIVKCTDNCSCLSVDKWDDEKEYMITTYKSYATKGWKSKLSDIWKIIKGDNVVDTELILFEEDFNKLRNF